MDRPEGVIHLSERELDGMDVQECLDGVTGSGDVSFHEVSLSKDGDDVSVTPGKITLSLDGGLREILSLLVEVADIDQNAHHEVSFEERYENIEDYERDGYVLASYAKLRDDLYRVVFQVPFYSEQALRRFAETIEEDEEEKTVFWEGSDPRVTQLVTVLCEDGWSPTDMFLDVEREVGVGQREGSGAMDMLNSLVEV